MDGQYWKGDPTMSTNEWLLTSDFWQFLEPWHGRWYEYEFFIASCTDNIYDLENERWLLGDMIDHVGIYGSRGAEGLPTFNFGLVLILISDYIKLASPWQCSPFNISVIIHSIQLNLSSKFLLITCSCFDNSQYYTMCYNSLFIFMAAKLTHKENTM